MMTEQEEKSAEMVDVVTRLVRMIVKHKDKVSVTFNTSGDMKFLRIDVDPEDARRVIGKNGLTIQGLKQLLAAAAYECGFLPHFHVYLHDSNPIYLRSATSPVVEYVDRRCAVG